jgi:hypothetical protein
MRIVGSLGWRPSFAFLWLTARKRPGKICRRQAFSPLPRPRRAAGFENLYNKINRLRSKAEVARRSHNE